MFPVGGGKIHDLFSVLIHLSLLFLPMLGIFINVVKNTASAIDSSYTLLLGDLSVSNGTRQFQNIFKRQTCDMTNNVRVPDPKGITKSL